MWLVALSEDLQSEMYGAIVILTYVKKRNRCLSTNNFIKTIFDKSTKMINHFSTKFVIDPKHVQLDFKSPESNGEVVSIIYPYNT